MTGTVAWGMAGVVTVVVGIDTGGTAGVVTVIGGMLTGGMAGVVTGRLGRLSVGSVGVLTVVGRPIVAALARGAALPRLRLAPAARPRTSHPKIEAARSVRRRLDRTRSGLGLTLGLSAIAPSFVKADRRPGR